MSGAAVPPRLAWAARLVDPRPGERILEVGCGGGGLLRLLSRPGVRVRGADRSAGAVARARRLLGATHPEVDVVEADLSALAAAPERADAVVCVNVNVFWTGRGGRACADAARLLAPGGRLVLVWQAPDAAVRDRIRMTVTANLAAAGLVTAGCAPPAEVPTGWAVVARAA